MKQIFAHEDVDIPKNGKCTVMIIREVIGKMQD